MARYIIRLDDISWDMNHQNFEKVITIFRKYNIKPLIGVIPNNDDEQLKKIASKENISLDDFFRQIKLLQDTDKWEIAMHGYNHKYTEKNAGIFGINNRSEFAGLSLHEQNKKIVDGKKLFEEYGIKIVAFMAPSHSLDWNTVYALKNNGIYAITDGLALYPYRKKRMLFVPQLFPGPAKMKFGIITFCFHINNWDNKRFKNFEQFLINNKNDCITFDQAIKISKKNRLLHKFFNAMFYFLLKHRYRS